jgi:hypothetical protein
MRPDLWLWVGSVGCALLAAILRAWVRPGGSGRRARAWGLWTPVALACLGLAAVAAGAALRTSLAGVWPGGAPADGIAVLAAGCLAIVVWVVLGDARRSGAGDDGLARHDAVPEAIALFGTGLLIALATGAAWGSYWPGFSAPATSWLFGLRVAAAGLGLGAWLLALADAAWSLRPAAAGESAASPGPRAMRAGYPWLTAAWLIGAVWSLAAAAVLWRGLPPEAWLTVAWLLGGIYLLAGSGQARVPRWALVILAACGMAAALLQAWQTPLLLP